MDRNPLVGLDRRDQVEVVDRDQLVVGMETQGSQLAMVVRQLWELLVLMHLVLLIVLCLPVFRACRAD